MQLVFLTNHVSPYRVSTLVELRKRVERLTVVLSSRDCAPGLSEGGVDVVVLPSVRLARTRRHDNGYRERYEVHLPYGVTRTLRELAPDCVVAAELGARTLLGALYCKLTGTPLVVHADVSEDYERGRGKLREFVRARLLERVDRVMVNGRSGGRYVASLGCDPARIVMLPYATDTDHFGAATRTAPDDGVLRLVYVGQLIERKGLAPFIVELARHLRAYPAQRVELTLAGDGGLRDALAALPRPANLSIVMPGMVAYDRLGAFYADHDVFVIPTLSDTWALVVNESMASGLPVLGSRQAQAVDEMIVEGREGWVFDATSARSVADAIGRCLGTPRDRRLAMGEAARRTALAFSPARSAGRIHEACRQAMQARGLSLTPSERSR